MNSPTHPSESNDSSSDSAGPLGPDPLARTKPKFSLNPIAIALVTLACAGRMYVALYGMEHDQDMLWVTDVMAGITGMILFSIGPAWLVWLVTRGRRSSATATCIIMLGLINLGYLNSLNLRDRQANEEALDEFSRVTDAQVDQNIDMLDRAMTGENVLEEAGDRFDKHMGLVEQLADNSSGLQSQVFAITAKVMRRLEEPFSAYSDTFNRFTEAGGIDPETMLDRAAIRDRLRMVDEFAAANELFDAAYASMAPDLRVQLKAIKLSDQQVDRYVADWKRGAASELIAQVRQTDRELAESFQGILNTLHTAFGRWSIEDDAVIFEDDAMLKQYNIYFDNMNDAATRQAALLRQVQQAVQGQQGTP